MEKLTSAANDRIATMAASLIADERVIALAATDLGARAYHTAVHAIIDRLSGDANEAYCAVCEACDNIAGRC